MTNTVIIGGTSYTDEDIVSGSICSEISAIGETLPYSTLDVELHAGSGIHGYHAGDRVEWLHGTERMGIWYVQQVRRTGKNKYAVRAADAIAQLAADQHMGGLYVGAAAGGVIRDVCGALPVSVKSSLAELRLYGWLPIASRRDNLRHILFALGAVAKADPISGTLHIVPLWRGTGSELTQLGIDASAEYPAPVSAVHLTEHQYTASDGDELQTLFEGVATASTLVTFSVPMHDLVATGFSILESGANYAVLGAGNGTLTGREYVHTTRIHTGTVTAGAAGNLVDYSNETLVGMTNAAEVLQRLVAYHSSANTITADIRYQDQVPGDVATLPHPWNGTSVSATIEQSDVTISGALKAGLKFRVGYLPPVPGSGYYGTRVLLTGSGNWTVPTGVTSVRVILIGGGSGGSSGLSGGLPATQQISTASSTQGNYTTDRSFTDPTLGGLVARQESAVLEVRSSL